jgi:hypothetical protein
VRSDERDSEASIVPHVLCERQTYRAGLRYEWLSMVYWLVKISQQECSGRALATWLQGLIGGHPTQSY